jgi:hypothetical protein
LCVSFKEDALTKFEAQFKDQSGFWYLESEYIFLNILSLRLNATRELTNGLDGTKMVFWRAVVICKKFS